MPLQRFFSLLFSTLFLASNALANELQTLQLSDDTQLEIRQFNAGKQTLLLGFPCDEGNSNNPEKTAKVLADDGVTVWMPDFLSAYMLPKLRSSLADIPDSALIELINNAIKNTADRRVFLIAGGSDTEILMRAARAWESQANPPARLGGAILLFPRLQQGEPVPGQEPVYIEAVGKTRLPLMVIEGERTPNRWGLAHLKQALAAGGSPVQTKLVPGIRGYFYNRNDPNESETLVTAQLSGLIKVSLYLLEHPHENTD